MPSEYLKILPTVSRKDANRLHQLIEDMAKDDVGSLYASDESYGDSWCKRGGPGAWMVTVRKYDRLENQLKNMDYNIFRLLMEDISADGPWDDIGDLTRYLMLIRCYVQLELEKEFKLEQEKKDAVAGQASRSNSD
jgi:hypothetical protein